LYLPCLLQQGFNMKFTSNSKKKRLQKRIEEAICTNVEEKLNSEEVKIEIERYIEEGQKKLVDDVAAQLKKEKETTLIEARQKEGIFGLDA
ncbi:hypothetical protein RDABS01_036291, partial [Bienertia sinuspersici]